MELQVIPSAPFRIVAVQFSADIGGVPIDAKLYHYRTRFDVKAGQAAVVENGGSLKIVTVVDDNVKETNYKGDLKWLVDVIDFDWYVAHLKEEIAIEQELLELERAAKANRKIREISDGLADQPELQAKLSALIERKKAL